MNDISDGFLLAVLVILVIISAFFSSSETGMMALNPYKLKTRTKHGQKSALRASKLLEHPDRLIGIILIGNNLVNIGASSIATVLATRHFGEAGILVATAVLTVVILVFAEVTPKTIAAQNPEKIALPASAILKPLLFLFWPLVWLLNHATKLLLKVFGVRVKSDPKHTLNADELKTVVEEAGNFISPTYRGMLLNILDLNKMTVEDIMVPRNEIEFIDLRHDDIDLASQIGAIDYTRVPVISGDINDTVGVLHMKKAITLFKQTGHVDEQQLLSIIDDPYFVPESTPLSTMMVNFQKQQLRIGLVVDEYGDIQGLVTLEDLLGEIVGSFTTDINESDDEIILREDGSALIDASTSIRDVNKALSWELPTDGPKTVNGLMVETLEQIPDAPVALEIAGYRLETKVIDKQRISWVIATKAS